MMPHESATLASEKPDKAVLSQEKMDLLVGYLLLTGVGLSMLLILAGLAWRFVREGRFTASQRLAGTNLFEFIVGEVRVAISDHIRPRTLVDGGIVVLMLTPYFRVFASMLYFMIALKNWKYSLFTAIVLGVLTFSLFIR